MTPTRILIGAAAAAMLAGAALAQEPSPMSEPKSDMASPPASSPMPEAAAPADAAPADAAPSAAAMGADASVTASAAADPMPGSTVTVSTTTNGPVPDTAENRAKYGKPMSRAGKMTRAAGN